MIVDLIAQVRFSHCRRCPVVLEHVPILKLVKRKEQVMNPAEHHQT